MCELSFCGKPKDIWLAAKYGDYDEVVVALEDCRAKGVDINECGSLPSNSFLHSNNCNPPLALACERGDIEIVRLLIDAGAELNEIPVANNSTFFYTHIKSMKSSLHYAIKGGHLEVVRLLLDSGADMDSSRINSLLLAIREGQTSIVELLLDRGADIEMKDGQDLTPIMLATSCMKLEIVKMLIERGADVNHIDKLGRAAINMIDYNMDNKGPQGVLEIAKALFNADADIDNKQNPRMGHHIPTHNPICEAAKYNRWDVVEYLLDCGADVHSVNDDGETLIHFLDDNVELIIRVIEMGADVNVRNKDGETPIYHACDDTIGILVDARADLNIVNNDGMTPLHDSIICIISPYDSNYGGMTLYLDYGADPNISNKYKMTPLLSISVHPTDGYGPNEIRQLVEHGAVIHTVDDVNSILEHVQEIVKDDESYYKSLIVGLVEDLKRWIFFMRMISTEPTLEDLLDLTKRLLTMKALKKR